MDTEKSPVTKRTGTHEVVRACLDRHGITNPFVVRTRFSGKGDRSLLDRKVLIEGQIPRHKVEQALIDLRAALDQTTEVSFGSCRYAQ